MKKKLVIISQIMSLLIGINCYANEKVLNTEEAVVVMVDGISFQVKSYNINGFNYFKLRDVSYIVNESNTPFSVKWNDEDNSIHISSGEKDDVVKPDLTENYNNSIEAIKSNLMISVDNKAVFFDTYNIDGFTYFKLRDLSESLGFSVNWDGAIRQISIDTKNENFAIKPQEYQKLLGRGMDVDWSKTNGGQENYNEKTVKDFVDAGVKHVRIRIADDAEDSLFYYLDQQIDDCLAYGLIPIIAYQADSFKNNPNEKNMEKVVKWWGTVANRYKDKSALLSFDLLIEATDELNKRPDELNELYERVTAEIRKTNPSRILIISPRMRSDATYLSELKIPTKHNYYLMAEWHFYASGPSKTNDRKLWTTGTEEEKKLVLDKIDAALSWQNATGVPTWVGAWMAGNYNDENDYSIEEQIAFAEFISSSLENAGIPFAVNSDTKFYNRETNEWYEEVIPLKNAIYGVK